MVNGKSRPQKTWFVPVLGKRPALLVGRDAVLAELVGGLAAFPGHRLRTSCITGPSGIGKTAVLCELAERAAGLGFVAVRVSETQCLVSDIIQIAQMNGSLLMTGKQRKPSVHTPQVPPGVGAGRKQPSSLSRTSLGFSAGLNFSHGIDSQYGHKEKLSLLCDELAAYGQGLLILLDDVRAGGGLLEFAGVYRQLAGEKKNIALIAAAQTKTLTSLPDADIREFFGQCHHIELGLLGDEDVRAYCYQAFKALAKTASRDILQSFAGAVKGYPYLLQVVGCRLLAYLGDEEIIEEEMIALALDDARQTVAKTVFVPCLKTLSKKDMAFLRALALIAPEKKLSAVAAHLKESLNTAQQYRLRLIDAGLVISAQRGELDFTLPYLDEFLCNEQG